MVVLQRTECAHSDLKFYKSLGSLIKDYRQWRQLTQESLAELIGISLRELQYWEKGSRNAHIGSLHDFAETTGIPMQVCIALNADQPVWYSLVKRVFAYSLHEASQLRVNGSLPEREEDQESFLSQDEPITTDKHLNAILSCHRQIHGTEIVLNKDVIRAAGMILPELNRIVFDSWGHYVGHNVCLPIKKDTYEILKQGGKLEEYPPSEIISDIVALKEGVFFGYSSFGVSISIAHLLLMKILRHQAAIQNKERYLVAFYPPSLEIKELFRNLDLRLAYRKVRDDRHGAADVAPPIYEIELDVMMRSLEPFLASPNQGFE